MKRITLLALILALALGLCACGNIESFEVDYGQSAIYDQTDMDGAIGKILMEFVKWDGCTLHSVRYAGDESCNPENLDWLNELRPGSGYTQMIEFVSDFHSLANGGGAWNEDMEYTDWQWYLARTEGGKWELVTWGY